MNKKTKPSTNIRRTNAEDANENVSASSRVSTTVQSERRSIRLSYIQMVQNFLLIWLDVSIGDMSNSDCRNTIITLRQVVNAVNTFTDANECVDFITEIKEEQVFMIISGSFGQATVPLVHDMSQVSSICIFCGNKTRHEKWGKNWSKIKGVFTDISPICEALKRAAHECDQNTISMSFAKPSSGCIKENLDQLDPSFMYTQILKEILLTIDFEQEHFKEFITYCREQFVDNTAELNNIVKLNHEYPNHQPIWWYTYPCFLYSMLNRALRTMEVDLIIKMGFFVRDLHQHIAVLHSEQFGGHCLKSFTVYRGQHMSQADFARLIESQAGLISFNNFLSTTLARDVSHAFCESAVATSDLMGILFVITIDPSISSAHFANIRDVSNYQGEEEILFSMHSIFRVRHVKQIDSNSRLWQVDLTLTTDNDSQLHALTERIREETFPRGAGWYRSANLLIKLGEFEKAQQVCEVILNRSSEQGEKLNIYSMIGMIKYGQGKYLEAITFHEKALQIRQKTLPPNHPGLAASYNNIGFVYANMGEYSKALSYHEKASEIYQKTLPPNHPDLATSYNNIGGVYDSMGDCSKALMALEKALVIKQNSLPANHPNLAVSYNNVGLLYDKMGKYSEALLSHEKALEIYQKSLAPNHPDLAISYNNIRLVYDNMSEYSKALSCHEKVLAIRQKSLPSNHPDLAASYNNIGLVYDKMSECSKALSYHGEALEIYQKALPPNHPNLATSFNNIGEVYFQLGDYMKARSFYERALDIQQCSLPGNHPHLQTVRENTEKVNKKL